MKGKVQGKMQDKMHGKTQGKKREKNQEKMHGEKREKIQENNDGRLLKRELKEKLDWYTLYASEEEYDEKAVESILYLLDNVDPLEEDCIPSSEEAWERFCRMQGNAKELLPLDGEEAVSLKNTTAPGKIETFVSGKTGAYAPGEESTLVSMAAGGAMADKAGDLEPDKNMACSNETNSVLRKSKGRIIKFVLHYKAAAAMLFLMIVIAVGGSIQAGAMKNNGFFFWLNRDETGTEMITSPEGLDNETSIANNAIYSDREDMPGWTQEWLEIEAEFEMPEKYEWQYYEIKEFEFIRNIIGYYMDINLEQEVQIGVYIYAENIFYNRDGFANFNYVDSYELDKKEMDIYNKTEETGEIFYAICFYEGNRKYYVSMQDNLDELKSLAEQYWNCVKKI